MRPAVFRKFKQFILYPDLTYKFLLSSPRNIISPDKFVMYLTYIFSQQRAYSFLAIKALLMLGSVYPKNCQTSSRLIILRYTKTRAHSLVYIPFTLSEATNILEFSFKRPISIQSATKSYIAEAKYFVFPGFVKHLRFPSWNYKVNLFFGCQSYWLNFYKSSIID